MTGVARFGVARVTSYPSIDGGLEPVRGLANVFQVSRFRASGAPVQPTDRGRLHASVFAGATMIWLTLS